MAVLCNLFVFTPFLMALVFFDYVDDNLGINF